MAPAVSDSMSLRDCSDLKLRINVSSSLSKYPAKQHARRVAERLKVDEGLIYLPGMPKRQLEDSDQEEPFRQRRYFYYLSGVDEPDCHLTYDIERDHLTLFIPRFDVRQVIWFGRGPTPAEAQYYYDVDSVEYASEYPKHIDEWLAHHRRLGKLYVVHRNQTPHGVAAISDEIRLSGRIDSTALRPAMDHARTTKDHHEIALIRQANEISAAAHTAVLRSLLTFSSEADVEATFQSTCTRHHAKHQAYDIIAASGYNAACLHYSENDDPLEGRQLMVLDAGCESHCYASDVTRTFPLKGVWPSEEAAAIYKLVQRMQDVCVKRLRPGAKYLSLHVLAHHVAIEGLLELGVLRNGKPEEIYAAGTSSAFFPHGLGHHVGLDVHDVAEYPLLGLCSVHGSDNEPVAEEAEGESKKRKIQEWPEACNCLQEGMVVTVEPGIYFSRYALNTLYLPSPVHSKYINTNVLQRYLTVGGVRIEDDFLITSSGSENLTTAPKGDDMLRIINGEDFKTDAKKDQYSPEAPLAFFSDPFSDDYASCSKEVDAEAGDPVRIVDCVVVDDKTSANVPVNSAQSCLKTMPNSETSATQPLLVDTTLCEGIFSSKLPLIPEDVSLPGLIPQEASLNGPTPGRGPRRFQPTCFRSATLRDAGVEKETAWHDADEEKESRNPTLIELAEPSLLDDGPLMRRQNYHPFKPHMPPELPQKPMAYRHSVPNLRRSYAGQPLSTGGGRSVQGCLESQPTERSGRKPELPDRDPFPARARTVYHSTPQEASLPARNRIDLWRHATVQGRTGPRRPWDDLRDASNDCDSVYDEPNALAPGMDSCNPPLHNEEVESNSTLYRGYDPCNTVPPGYVTSPTNHLRAGSVRRSSSIASFGTQNPVLSSEALQSTLDDVHKKIERLQSCFDRLELSPTNVKKELNHRVSMPQLGRVSDKGNETDITRPNVSVAVLRPPLEPHRSHQGTPLNRRRSDFLRRHADAQSARRRDVSIPFVAPHVSRPSPQQEVDPTSRWQKQMSQGHNPFSQPLPQNPSFAGAQSANRPGIEVSSTSLLDLNMLENRIANPPPEQPSRNDTFPTGVHLRTTSTVDSPSNSSRDHPSASLPFWLQLAFATLRSKFSEHNFRLLKRDDTTPPAGADADENDDDDQPRIIGSFPTFDNPARSRPDRATPPYAICCDDCDGSLADVAGPSDVDDFGRHLVSAAHVGMREREGHAHRVSTAESARRFEELIMGGAAWEAGSGWKEVAV